MNLSKTISPVCACVPILLAITLTGAWAAGGQFEDLTLEVKTERAQILPWEALPIQIEVRNETQHEISGYECPCFDLYLARGGEPFEALDLRGSVSWLARTTPVPPGFKRTERELLWWGNTPIAKAAAFFPQPGSYRLKVMLRGNNGKSSIESNVAEIEVTRPGKRDLAAWEFLMRLPDSKGRFFFAPARPDGRVKLEQFVAAYPDSVYAAYARCGISQEWLLERDYARAVSELQSVLDAKDFPMRRQALGRLSRCYLKMDQIEEAEKTVARLKAEFPGDETTKEAANELERTKRVREENRE